MLRDSPSSISSGERARINYRHNRGDAMGTTVSFNRPDGKAASGYLAEPAHPAGAPAVVVIQEWWGLNDQIRGVADRLAQSRFLGLVPHLYPGKAAGREEGAAPR